MAPARPCNFRGSYEAEETAAERAEEHLAERLSTVPSALGASASEVAMTYREALTASMTEIGRDQACVFVGYGLLNGKGAMGTLAGVPEAQLIEFTVAEGLMVSAAIGLALAGMKPVVYFERADFIWNAMDAIVNHLDAINELSRGEFKPGVIIRVTVGNKKKPLFTGRTHTRDNGLAVAHAVRMLVCSIDRAEGVADRYTTARERQDRGESTILYEYKDLFT